MKYLKGLLKHPTTKAFARIGVLAIVVLFFGTIIITFYVAFFWACLQFWLSILG